MNTKAYFQSMGNAIRSEERAKELQVQLAERLLARWEKLKPHFSNHWQERGEYVASNLRGTYRAFPDSMLCASLASDLGWCISKGIVSATISDSEVQVQSYAGSCKTILRKWDDVNESNKGTVILMSKGAGYEGRLAGEWISNGNGTWSRKQN